MQLVPRWIFQKLSYSAIRLGFAAGRLIIRILPRTWAFAISDFLARVAFTLFRGFRKRSLQNLEIAFSDGIDPAEGRRIVHRSLRSFFRACIEAGIALDSGAEALRDAIPVSGRDHLDAAIAKGRGVILLSAHLGNFFLIGTRLAVEGYSIHVLVNQPEDSHLARLMDDYRLQVRQKTIHARPRREALRTLHQVLRRNEVAVVIADEYRKGNGIRVPLFGRMVLARRGPATLASRTGAAIVPVYMLREADDGLRLVIEPELELARNGKGPADIRENTFRITRWLERTVRAHPEQWNWMNIRWWENEPDAMAAGQHHFENLTS
jgi:KDO2-lipid IV(A) lauroyltransferase